TDALGRGVLHREISWERVGAWPRRPSRKSVPAWRRSCGPSNGWYDQRIGLGGDRWAPMDVSCSARLLQPLVQFASSSEAYRDLVPDHFRSMHPDARVSLEAVHAVLDQSVERTRDEALGLTLGRSMCLGAGGLFDYGVQTAATVRDAVAFAG